MDRRMAGRAAVERAKGILMRARGLSEGDAYRLLRRESQNLRRPLPEVAGAVVATEGRWCGGTERGAGARAG